MNEKKELKISLGTAIALIISMALIGVMTGVIFYFKMSNSNIIDKNDKKVESNNEEVVDNVQAFKYTLTGNSLEDFDLRFLQLENTKENKIYSPLSIKSALAMLNEGAEGETKKQISNLIGNYKATKYINSKNMAFANGIFVKDTYKNSIKESYISNLKNKYNAEVKYDSFNSAQAINSWTRKNTLELIDNIMDDESVNDLSFLLINSLGIDMEWKQKFFVSEYVDLDYSHEKYKWTAPIELMRNKFENMQNEVYGMGIIASINNYDIVKELGEDNIRKTVGDEFRKYLNEDATEYDLEYYLEGKDIETAINDYLDTYIKEINENYGIEGKNTDFYIYNDENVKAFAKDLKTYNGMTLQYVAIMPEDLNEYIEKITAKEINTIIENLKDIKSENFKEGVLTQIVGYIPKFEFEYELDLKNDLNKMGITEVFDEEKANLSGIIDEQTYIDKVIHKANIEFTEDGIKAAAATMEGGYGAGGSFDYLYDIPVEEIDMTFDKPYMFIIREKEKGEVWFVGTVYKPLELEQDDPKVIHDQIYEYSSFSNDIRRVAENY